MPETWYVHENDEIGGWAVMTSDNPPSVGAGWMVATFVHESDARRIVELNNAAAVGRLLPDGGETRTEWGVRETTGDDTANEYAVRVGVDEEQDRLWAARDVRILGERGQPALLLRREVREWSDGGRYAGPWVEVTDA